MENKEKVGWAKYYEVAEDLQDSVRQDNDYIEKLIKSLKQTKGNKTVSSLIDVFLWEFIDSKEKVFDATFYDYTTIVSYDENTPLCFFRTKNGITTLYEDTTTDTKLKPWIHKTPDGESLYRTKKNNGGHVKTRNGIRITKKDFVIDFDKFKFKLNDTWEFIVTKKPEEENGGYEEKGYWIKKNRN